MIIDFVLVQHLYLLISSAVTTLCSHQFVHKAVTLLYSIKKTQQFSFSLKFNILV